jgi:hypothetical protein
MLVAAACGWSLVAQTPSTEALPVPADLNQLMRGAFYPAANVVFSAQLDNPGDVKFVPGRDPNMSTDPLTSTFGGWVAVENAALTLADPGTTLRQRRARADEGSGLGGVRAGCPRRRPAGLQGGPGQRSGQDRRGVRCPECHLFRLPPQMARPQDAGEPLPIGRLRQSFTSVTPPPRGRTPEPAVRRRALGSATRRRGPAQPGMYSGCLGGRYVSQVESHGTRVRCCSM